MKAVLLATFGSLLSVLIAHFLVTDLFGLNPFWSFLSLFVLGGCCAYQKELRFVCFPLLTGLSALFCGCFFAVFAPSICLTVAFAGFLLVLSFSWKEELWKTRNVLLPASLLYVFSVAQASWIVGFIYLDLYSTV